MANFVANAAKGRLIELYRNVDANSPTGCAFLIVAFTGTALTEAGGQDLDTLADVEGSALAEVLIAHTGYARKVLVAADLAAQAVDDTNNRQAFTLPAQSWTLTASGTAWSQVGLFYRPSAAPADSAIEFCGMWDFATTGGIATETITFPDPVYTAT
jgi:hypothetical protein